ncbi:MAG: TldD/PmbA family protein [Promethearchaeota archaeon]
MTLDNDLLKYTVDTALNEGVRELIVKYSQKREHQIRFSNSAIDIYKQWNQNLMEIFLSIGRKITVIGIQNPTKESIKAKLRETMGILKQFPRSLLYWGMEKESNIYPKIEGLYDPRIKDFPSKAPELVNAAIDASMEAGAKKTAGVLYFGAIKTGALTGYGNGGTFDSSYFRLTIRSFVDPESSGQDMAVGRKMENLEKQFSEAGANAGKLAKMAVGGRQGEPGKYDIILSPTVAANIFNHLADGANPVYIIGGMSCLRGKANQQIGPKNLNISDDATIPEGLNSRPFDYEGVKSQKTPLIENGKFIGMIQNTSSAKIWKWLNWLKFNFKQGFRSTGNSYLGGLMDEDIGPKVLAPIPSNYVYSPGDFSLEEIISESKRPTIYITSNWYTRFTNYMEGRFSTIPRDGMFLIENGEIKKPVRKLRLSETLTGMLKRITAIGKDQKQINWWEVATPTFIPTIKVADCNITTATE